MWTCSEAEMGEGKEFQQDPQASHVGRDLGPAWRGCRKFRRSGRDGPALLPWSKDGAQKVPEPEDRKRQWSKVMVSPA